MNGYLIFIVGFIVVHFFLDVLVSILNVRSLDPELPEEFIGVYDKNEYSQSQEYTKVTTRFSIIQTSFSTGLTLLFILFGGFNYLDLFARSFEYSELITGLIFIFSLGLLSSVISLPFSIYSTFVIEQRFGFNTTTVRTFILDMIKGAILSILLGAPLLAFILWFFETSGDMAWLYCWAAVVAFILIMQFIAPVVIMPIFNKFTPLEDGELRESVVEYAHKENFAIQGVYTMDGSKRSTKLNAFFTGFGKFRRIVFFDTLIEKVNIGELIAILAHEMGHYKKKHIVKMMLASTIQTGVMFFILSLFLLNEGLFAAFQMEQLSVYGSLVFFGFLYSPLSTFLSVIFNIVSRHHEYEADAYAAQTTGDVEHMVSGLKKLSVSNLSNLTPHPLHVFLHYSHPPVLARIRALQQLSS